MISEEDLEQAYWNSAQCYPWRVNQLGGRYVNGKPLPLETRMQILYCARNGVRPCDISRQMKITHGCISKLLAKFKRTGSMVPGSVSSKHTFTGMGDFQDEPSFRNIHSNEFHNENRLITVQKGTCGVNEVEYAACGIRDCAASRTDETKTMHDSEDESKDGIVESKVSSSGEATTETFLLKPYKHSIDEILCNTKSKEKNQNTELPDVSNRVASPTIIPRKSSQRTHFSRKQLQVLNEEFVANQYPGLADRQKLAKDLDVHENKIRIWFSNRRAKCRQSSREIQDRAAAINNQKRNVVPLELCCSTCPRSYCQCYVLSYNNDLEDH